VSPPSTNDPGFWATAYVNIEAINNKVKESGRRSIPPKEREKKSDWKVVGK